MIIFRSVVLGMRNVSDTVVDKITTRNLCSITFISENLTVYQVMGRNVVEPECELHVG